MQLLATFILLSYTKKILKTIITALDATEVLQAGSAENVSDPLVPYEVWIYSYGNIEYLDATMLLTTRDTTTGLASCYSHTVLSLISLCDNDLPS